MYYDSLSVSYRKFNLNDAGIIGILYKSLLYEVFGSFKGNSLTLSQTYLHDVELAKL